MRNSVERHGPQHEYVNLLIDETTVLQVCPDYEHRRVKFMAEFLKKNGHAFRGIPFDTKFPFMGVGGRCYDQAMQLVSMTGLIYCEGVMMVDLANDQGVFPMPHAWCCKPDGAVVDPTTPQLQDHPRIVYFGVPFRHAYVLNWWKQWGFNGLLDGHPEYGDQIGVYADPIAVWRHPMEF